MRYLIISDIHANLEALNAVLGKAAGEYDSIVCCGDVVGYGAEPNAVADWVRGNVQVTVRGNHDRACASLAGIDWFNPLAQTATRWTHETLSAENRTWLNELPQGPAAVEDFQVVHGSPLDEDEYLLSVGEATEAFAYSAAPLTFFGHTHVQCGFEQTRMRTWRWGAAEMVRPTHLADTAAYLVNPGSVGQPRDGDPRAAYALFDSATGMLQLCRADYDIAAAQRKIVDAGLPLLLAHRLSSGN